MVLQSDDEDNNAAGLFKRTWHAFSPFSSSALASLPENQRPLRYTREDDIPDVDHDIDGQRPTIRDYNAINSVPPQIRVPKKVATSLKVEGKVWFANERSQRFSSHSSSSFANAHKSVDILAESLSPLRNLGACPIQFV